MHTHCEMTQEIQKILMDQELEETLENLLKQRPPKILTGQIKIPNIHEFEGGFANVYVGFWEHEKVDYGSFFIFTKRLTR